jgi:hypothetical protein
MYWDSYSQRRHHVLAVYNLPLQLKEQWREMVFWPKLSLRVGKESTDRHFAFSEKLSEIGMNLTHLAY